LVERRNWTRRELGRLAGAIAAGSLLPRRARGQARARVVVVGGGVGGATAAKYLALASKAIDITLVEPEPLYITCFFSDLYLAGLRSLDSLTHNYDALSARYGITVMADAATAIDAVRRTVRLRSGRSLDYDRLVLAPGIALRFDAIEGYDEAAARRMPHAWTAGPQTALLRRQLEGMADGEVFVIVAPPAPYRCPPAPYERASLVASYFKRNKPSSKIIILDAKDSFFGQDLFQEGWRRHYGNMIEWLPAQFTDGIKAVDVKARTIVTGNDRFPCAVANVIPPQKAGQIAQAAGLADASGWCPVDPLTFESTRLPGIHLVGDAIIAGQMPKSGFAANSQAKACARAIAAALGGGVPEPTPLVSNCYTFLAPDDAVRNEGQYRATKDGIRSAALEESQLGESAAQRAAMAAAAAGWYDAFTTDIFG
jgi:sulfide dehydrogenase [flavocytochrome c] flavoprotein subunit